MNVLGFKIAEAMTLEDTYTSPIGFITKKLELPLYEWQGDAVTAVALATATTHQDCCTRS
jgi:hypothetical protein